MIDRLYQLVNKGSYRALSLILAIVLMVSIFLNAKKFALELGGPSPLFTLFLIWGTSTLWIHGMGLEIRKDRWKAVFNPLIGYCAAIGGLFYIYFI
ncbi:cyd operon protein YbgE [Testudinibacter sp. TR-2022]|uniref:cyd operon protein YbgE n=1 Tax=Testudinibacter sp. TR-2022 TaxID=2585029 RepID=UPI00111A9912|nr:cyd operon protein YbgE [Testudinibacter sp. TR-2022]TNH04939.1 cyd operon protein YbgE [Pasteurellaceae bacterium Phil31]TNH08143.1 cyd operon protein YbgE [Testudinibacter sp. TR-2022]TNH10807.1 cyd operon protein YbgE [Testudinibacter sp. TR-2022]TNH16493.1 cyd operon protein YbgE [Testudinibacter sp. TR-2022]TNH19536.1 cyd operon protein YbgE [Testudinibacter sp. TR-2022]